ncbi:methionyl-tRNA formyltransferase Fmt [Thermosynechococcus sp. NK55a]|uniref:methionyl-tRNA formyltransferase n=1 Tax=unclassified Thermosynechococcus TaxID=2622553 RepID=UPI0003D7ADD4|nr:MULTISPECIES: methionyl-tRNA formyltransferase [unclassified Thermosynechococcus]AHB88514.1 methionyl-tRNA formyltransferase Fmt [Thermosynechococcus sp. NK55a]RMH66766.1 MAG: methionyl-tRNA formyltransferase [Cyanobacteria bacterium J003]HIK23471.1 methionyl-tRNA formyltransferase [Thermosynechococcus sp. M3746_W2019_013]
MNIVYFGTPEFALAPLQRLLATETYQVLGVVTQPDRRRGRGNQLSPSPVKALALRHRLPIWQPPSLRRDPQLPEVLRSLAADVFVVVAYGQILPQSILEIPRYGCINIHGSLLPKYRGAAPIQWALYHGEQETGVTTMLMDAGLDTGPMLLKRKVGIHLEDNAATLSAKLSEIGADLLLDTLQQLPQLQAEPQNDAEATYAPLIQKRDYAIDWERSALALHNQVRAFYPYAYTQWQGTPLKILQTWPLIPEVAAKLPEPLQSCVREPEASAAPGTVLALVKGWGPVVQTGKGGLLLSQVQLSGRKAQSGWDFVNGVRLAIATQFGILSSAL